MKSLNKLMNKSSSSKHINISSPNQAIFHVLSLKLDLKQFLLQYHIYSIFSVFLPKFHFKKIIVSKIVQKLFCFFFFQGINEYLFIYLLSDNTNISVMLGFIKSMI